MSPVQGNVFSFHSAFLFIDGCPGSGGTGDETWDRLCGSGSMATGFEIPPYGPISVCRFDFRLPLHPFVVPRVPKPFLVPKYTA